MYRDEHFLIIAQIKLSLTAVGKFAVNDMENSHASTKNIKSQMFISSYLPEAIVDIPILLKLGLNFFVFLILLLFSLQSFLCS